MSIFEEIPVSWLSTKFQVDLQKIESAARIISSLSAESNNTVDIFPSLYESQVPDQFFEKHWPEFCSVASESFKIFLKTNELSFFGFGQREFELCQLKYSISDRFNPIAKSLTRSTKFHEVWNIESNDYYPLLDYQEDIYVRAKGELATPYSRLVIQMPTGSGKTRTAMELVCDVLNSNKSVIWLANTEELCDQAFETFLKTWPMKALVDSEAYNLVRYPKSKSINPTKEAKFFVSSIQSLWSNQDVSPLIKETSFFDNLDLVVFDEAHMAIAKTYNRILTELLARSKYSAKFIGLTATPGRGLTNSLKRFNPELEDENRSLAEFFNNKLISLRPLEGYADTFDFLKSRGVMAKIKLHRIEGLTILDSYKDISPQLRDLVSNSRERNFNLIAAILVQLKLGKRILLFANSVDHSRFIVSIITALGYTSQHLDANSSDRDSIISNFKSGNTQLLSNYGILSTGFDDPKLEVIFISRLTKSIVLYSQMIGRVLRGETINGTENASVFTVDDNIKGLPKNDEIYNYFDSYFSI